MGLKNYFLYYPEKEKLSRKHMLVMKNPKWKKKKILKSKKR